MSAELRSVRNIGIAAHIDAGKTTTTERILFYARKTHRMGEVDSGTATTDFDEQEQQRGITIYSAAVTLPWRGHTINLIDTPGHVDFTAEVERSLRVLDGMVAVFDAKEGVEAQSETVWRQADKYHVPRLCFINKMDRVGADFEASVESIRARLHVTPLVLQLPIGAAETFKGLIDLIEMKAYYNKTEGLGSSYDVAEIPDELSAGAVVARHDLIEAVSETSETLLEKYLHGQEISPDELRAGVREATLRRELFPVLCGSAFRFIGVQRLLDAVCDFLPSPLDVPPVVGKDPKHSDKTKELPCDPAGPLAAVVFKIVAERPVDLYFLRLYSGTLKANTRVINAGTGEKENIAQIYRMFAKRRDQIDEASAGDIVAVVGPKRALTGHTLCAQKGQVVLEAIEFPETVISVSVEPKASRDRDKLLEALSALTRQDPTLRVSSNKETGQTIISGMGELHLEVAVRRLRDDMSVDAIVGKPRVSYRETVTATGVGKGRFVRQFGGRNHFAAVRIQLEPYAHEPGRQNFEILNEIAVETLRAEYLEATKAGLRDAAQSGILGGYRVIDWRATLVGVEQHEVDSSELAFENAARVAFYEAMKASSPMLMEPIMDVEVVTADEYFGSIVGDLNARNAVIRNTVLRGSDHVISADVPLAQSFGYVTKLRSLSQGRATSSMTPLHYARVSAAAMKDLVG